MSGSYLRTDAHKRQMSQRLKGRVFSDEHKKKLRDSWKNRRNTPNQLYRLAVMLSKGDTEKYRMPTNTTLDTLDSDELMRIVFGDKWKGWETFLAPLHKEN